MDIFYGWGWLDVYFSWLRVVGHFSCVGEDWWGWAEVYFGCVGVGGHF